MTSTHRKLTGLAAIAFAAILAMATAVIHPRESHAAPSGALLTGTVTSDSGEKMSGVVVSAQAEGKLIITSVYTDEQGHYYFPALDGGAYNVWAQAVGYETGKSHVDLNTAVRG